MFKDSTLITLVEAESHFGYARGSLSSLRAKGYMPNPDKEYGRTPLWKVSTLTKWVDDKRSGTK